MRKWVTAVAIMTIIISYGFIINLGLSGRYDHLMPVAIVSGFFSVGYLFLNYLLPESMFGGRRMASGRVALLRRGGRSERGWALGGVPLLRGVWAFRWTVWMEGIEIAPIGMPSFAIRFSEMEHVGYRPAFRVIMAHHAPEVVRPLQFIMSKWTAIRLVNALEAGMTDRKWAAKKPQGYAFIEVLARVHNGVAEEAENEVIQ